MTALTAVIPAAGRGSRLGFDGPKALAPLCGRTLLDFVIDALRTQVDEIVVVTSPAYDTVLRDHVAGQCPGHRVSSIVQAEPTGSADAVRLGLSAATSPACIVAWCDQVGLRSETVDDVARRLRARPGRVVLPLARVSAPYVWVERDAEDRVRKVGRVRDGDTAPATGLSDLGLFGLPSDAAISSGTAGPGREADFVYELERFSALGILTSFVVEELHQTLAVNTAHDLDVAAEILEGVLP